MTDSNDLAQIPPISPDNWVDDHPLVAGLLHGPYHASASASGNGWRHRIEHNDITGHLILQEPSQ